MAPEQLKQVLESHRLWRIGDSRGSRANLSWADLSWADLSGADLSWADLSGADLSWANLSGADLSRANLSGANLSRANLSGANLSRAKVPREGLRAVPPMVLLANWGGVSDKLCRDLMRYDAANHPKPETFNEWTKAGNCPYAATRWTRAAIFNQNVDLWSPRLLKKPAKSALQLVQALLKEKCELIDD